VVAGQQRRAQRKEAVERAKEEKAIAETKLGQVACLLAQNNMRNLLDRLREHLGHFDPLTTTLLSTTSGRPSPPAGL
tara:strand:- start:650 stop:880 length:231 start_codon:yes stop_codon:yes gene_type:complete